MSLSAWLYVGLRVLYNFAYVNISTVKKSFIRTGIWAVGTLICLSFYVRSALA